MPAAREQVEAEREDRDPDRKVHEEDPVPVERVRQHTAEQHADRAAARRDEPEDAHRLRPVGRLGEERHHDRERDRRDNGATQALDGPRRDQERLARRGAARERRQREERDPGEKEPAVAEQVTQAAAEEQEAPEREQVGVHDPRERGLGEAEIGADRRQRHVHDRRVEHDHQGAEAEHVESDPAFLCVDGHRGVRLRSRRKVIDSETMSSGSAFRLCLR